MIISSSDLFSQNVAVTDDDSYTAASSAMLDVKSTTKGMLIPRLDSTQRRLISGPVLGLLVFDTSLNSFMYYNGSSWITIPQMSTSATAGKALFAVKNADGDTVFAVYNDGVKVTVDEGSKGSVGGFAVSGRTPTKAGAEVQYFRVTPDSTRIYINDTAAVKGTVGGFAVSGRTPTKTGEFDYLTVTPDSTRVYVNEGFTKGTVGGFAVSGRTPTKLGPAQKYMDMTSKNYLIGQLAGEKITTGLYNTILGFEAGKLTNTGSYNTLLGFKAGNQNTSGAFNVFIGNESGFINSDDSSNVFIGNQSGYYSRASNNVFMGFQSGMENRFGENNVFIGYKTGLKNGDSFNNVFIGYEAGLENNGGYDNVFIGSKAGQANTTGDNNVFIGKNAGIKNQDGGANVFIGQAAGVENTNGMFNLFFGNMAAYKNTIGSYNIFMGSSAGLENTEGENNIYLGKYAGNNNRTGDNNIALGEEAGYNNRASYNLFFGFKAGYYNALGERNIYLGNAAGFYNNGGLKNVFIGDSAGYNSYSSNNNIFIGDRTGYKNNYATNNVFIGNQAGYNTSGNGTFLASSNVFIGNLAGLGNTTGYSNIFIGDNAGPSNTIGQYNVFLGYLAGNLNQSGIDNILIGRNSGNNNQSGDFNVAIGTNAGYSVLGDSNIFIGYNAGYNETGSNKLYVDNSNTSSPLIYGDFTDGSEKIVFNGLVGIGTSTPYKSIHIYKSNSTTDGTDGTFIDIQNPLAVTGIMTGIRFKPTAAANGEYTKGAIFYQRTTSAGRGSLIFANNSSSGSDEVTTAHARMVILNNGYIGIGTTSPAAQLHIVTTGTPRALRISGTASNSFAEAQFANDIREYRIGVGGSAVTNGVDNKFYLWDYSAGVSRMVVDTSGNVGIGTTIPNSRLHVKGAISLPITTISATTTLDASYYTVLVNAVSVSIMLPQASTCNGRIYIIKKITATVGNVTIDADSTETIDGSITQTLSTQYQKMIIQSNGISWYILN